MESRYFQEMPNEYIRLNELVNERMNVLTCMVDFQINLLILNDAIIIHLAKSPASSKIVLHFFILTDNLQIGKLI